MYMVGVMHKGEEMEVKNLARVVSRQFYEIYEECKSVCTSTNG